MENFQKDKNGYIDIKGDNVKSYRKLSTHPRVRPVEIDGKMYYFKSDNYLDKTLAKSAFKTNGGVDDVFAKGNYYSIGEIYLSKLAKKLGINTVDYHLAKLNNQTGVISNDYVDMQDGQSGDLSVVLDNIELVDIALLHEKGFFDKCTTGLVDDTLTLLLFDFVTMQVDRNANNLAVAKENCDKFNKLIGLDYANNGISITSMQPKNKYWKKHFEDGRWTLSFGLEDSNTNEYIFLRQAMKSPYMRGRVLCSFVDLLDKSLVNNRIITDIHNEVVEEYSVSKDDLAINTFENKLKDTLEKQGELLDVVSKERVLPEIFEK